MYYHLIILLSFVFYISGNVGNTTLGLPYMFLLGLPLVYGAFIIFRYKQHSWTYAERQMLWIVGGAIFMSILRYMTDNNAKLMGDVTILILPALLISAFPIKMEMRNEYFRTKDLVAQFILIFYVIECSIAILEFATHSHLFGWFEPTYGKSILSFGESEEFRSVALMGGPLNNAMIVTIIMLFYLFDRDLPTRGKMILWVLGLTAVFAFNARMAIVVNLLGMVLFTAKGAFGKYPDSRNRYLLMLLATCAIVFFLYTFGLGGRLWETGNLVKDSSIEIRLKLFKYMWNKDWSNNLWGSSYSQLQREMGTSIHVKIIENFWIWQVLRFGLVATVYFTIFYFRLCRSLFRSYPVFDKVAISSLFLILCSSNISIASQFTPLFVFLLCAYTYSPAGGAIYSLIKEASTAGKKIDCKNIQ